MGKILLKFYLIKIKRTPQFKLSENYSNTNRLKLISKVVVRFYFIGSSELKNLKFS